MEVTRCKECGFGYIKALASNRTLHRQHHRRVSLLWPATRNEATVGEVGRFRVVAIRPTSPKWLQERGARVARRGNRDTIYDKTIYPDSRGEWVEFQSHAFVGVLEARAVSIVVITRRSHVARFTWAEFDGPFKEREWDRTDASQLTINFVWTHLPQQRKGFATEIIRRSAQFFEIRPEELAWYTPLSSSGKALARAVSPDAIVVATGDGPVTVLLRTALELLSDKQ